MQINLPESLAQLFEPNRYKVLFGGRGGAKSESVARALLIMGMQRPMRVLCARELQVSIKESVHHLLKALISQYELDAFYEVQATSIKGKNGTEFIFKGLKHNINEIKSLNDVDVCWVEEAANVSKASWEVLIPTIRKEGSEIWITFNPELDTDETYKRFVLNPPANVWVKKVNWSDNPWFPSVLRDEMETLKERDYDAYLTIWEGHCKQVLDGAIYAGELRKATEEGRIRGVPYDPSKPVHTFWDLGWADNTSIWFAQAIGFEYRIIDYYENRQQSLQHYLTYLQNRGYVYGKHWLPHDARAKQLGTGKSIEELVRNTLGNVRITPKLSVNDGIQAARTVFAQCYFDESKCADGLQALRRYRYDTDDNGHFKSTPLHDENSHGADAFRYFAVSVTQETTAKDDPYKNVALQGSWMAM